jgi:hypothetical protein
VSSVRRFADQNDRGVADDVENRARLIARFE